MQITPLGDSALIIRAIDNREEVAADVVERVLEIKHRVEAAEIPGIVELAPAYTTVAAFYDPPRVIDGGAPVEDVVGWIEQRIRAALLEKTHVSPVESRRIEISVCYDDEFALDHDEVAERARLDWKQVVDLHSGAEYRVHCVGFTPGFPF